MIMTGAVTEAVKEATVSAPARRLTVLSRVRCVYEQEVHCFSNCGEDVYRATRGADFLARGDNDPERVVRMAQGIRKPARVEQIADQPGVSWRRNDSSS